MSESYYKIGNGQRSMGDGRRATGDGRRATGDKHREQENNTDNKILINPLPYQ